VELKAKAKRLFCSVPMIVVVAFVVRMAVYYPFSLKNEVPMASDRVPYGAETGAVAAAIAEGRGFSSPLPMMRTGATAWLAPVYPYVLAGIFILFGVYSYLSNVVIHIFDITCSAFTCWPIAAMATRAFGKKTGTAAAWLWVFLPTAIFYPVVWVWDTALTGLWMAILIAAALQLRGSDRTSWWIGYGALWSAGAMINPSLISVLPFVALWALWPTRKQLRLAFKLASAAGLVFALGVVPWTVRNYTVFHQFIPLRSNFGLELWLGNNPSVPDSWTPWLHPTNDQTEAIKYVRMTEVPYMAEKEREALAFIRSHPVDTARFILHRFADHWLGVSDTPADFWPTAPWYLRIVLINNCMFALLAWTGALLACRTRNPAAYPLGMVMLIFPVAFYLTHTSLRYRLPMEPIMQVLAAFAVVYVVSHSARRSAVGAEVTAEELGNVNTSMQPESVVSAVR
jgi:4-amino-4-deoxy-L-arabinose transferase-like glycosyltransferase